MENQYLPVGYKISWGSFTIPYPPNQHWIDLTLEYFREKLRESKFNAVKVFGN